MAGASAWLPAGNAPRWLNLPLDIIGFHSGKDL